MDAIAVLMPLFNAQVRHLWVIEGDITSFFDNVHHRKLMTILRRRIADQDMRDLIWKFLKAGVMQGHLFAKTAAGVAQGGVLSPMLANVYLNEIDKWAEAAHPKERPPPSTTWSPSAAAATGRHTLANQHLAESPMQGNLPVRFGEGDRRIQARQQAHGAPVPTLRDPTPSPEDVRVTEMLVEAGKLLDIAVLDYMVIGRNRFVSLKEPA